MPGVRGPWPRGGELPWLLSPGYCHIAQQRHAGECRMEFFLVFKDPEETPTLQGCYNPVPLQVWPSTLAEGLFIGSGASEVPL